MSIHKQRESDLALNELQLGQLVRSRAGRDLGCYYLVYRLTGPNKAWLVDGRGRNTANPKAKNPRHLQRVNQVSARFVAALKGGDLTPELIRAELNSLLAHNAKENNPDEEALANVES